MLAWVCDRVCLCECKEDRERECVCEGARELFDSDCDVRIRESRRVCVRGRDKVAVFIRECVLVYLCMCV